MTKEEILKAYFGYDSFRDNQGVIIDNIVSKKDTIAVLPTGGGKSIIFQIAGLMFTGKVVIITPLIALMKDQVENLLKHNIKATYLSSENKDSINALADYKFIYLTGEMFISLKLKLDISLVVVDEAHTIFWGYDFREKLLEIGNAIKTLDKRPVIAAFTATIPKYRLVEITKILGLNTPYINYSLPIKDNINYYTVCNYYLNHLHIILNRYKRVIIYTVTIKACEYLYELLKNKYKIGIYHGKMEDNDKTYSQDMFKSGNFNVMVCTNAFGMGIDIRDIRAVVLYELPLNLNDLIQQLGRAGRDGKKCYGFIFYNKNNIEYLFKFMSKSKYYKTKSKEFNKVIEFALSSDKKKYLKNYYNSLDF